MLADMLTVSSDLLGESAYAVRSSHKNNVKDAQACLKTLLE